MRDTHQNPPGLLEPPQPPDRPTTAMNPTHRPRSPEGSRGQRRPGAPGPGTATWPRLCPPRARRHRRAQLSRDNLPRSLENLALAFTAPFARNREQGVRATDVAKLRPRKPVSGSPRRSGKAETFFAGSGDSAAKKGKARKACGFRFLRREVRLPAGGREDSEHREFRLRLQAVLENPPPRSRPPSAVEPASPRT